MNPDLRGGVFLGVDPGQSGGVAVVNLDGKVIEVFSMPKTERDISDRISTFRGHAHMAVIEKVHAMPKQGVSSSFKFGMSYGGLRMALIAHRIPFEAVSPGVWQREMGCLMSGRTGPSDNKTAKKNHTKARAQEMFPNCRITHAVADALLIAEYCRRVFLLSRNSQAKGS